jgi:hypothetical protein
MTAVDISKGITLDVDFEKIMAYPAVVEAAVRFAVKQALTNTHASIKVGEEDAVAKSQALAEKRLEAMYAGSWGQTERGPRGDAVAREMAAMAEAAIKAKLPKGQKWKDYSTETRNKVIAMQIAANEAAYRAAAEAKLAIKPEGEESADDIMAMLTAASE